MQYNLFKKTPAKRTIFFVLADIVFIFISVWLSFLLRFDFDIPSQYLFIMYRVAFLAIIFLLPVFHFYKLYSFSWAYVSTEEAISLFKATTVGFALLGAAIFTLYYFPNFASFPRSTIAISYIMVFIFCGGIRFAKRIYLRVSGKDKSVKKDRTLIVGAGDAGEQILRSILFISNSPYLPVGFVDDSKMKQKVLIHGMKVLGRIADIPKISAEHDVKQIIIALPSASNKIIKNAVELARQAGIWKIKMAPPISEIIRGKVSFKSLKDVGAEDLLGRDQVLLDEKQIEGLIKGKTVLITGAAGSIGSELARQSAKFSPGMILLLDQDETGIFNIEREMRDIFPGQPIRPLVADITDKEKINKIFKEYGPKVIFHAAAYKHVPLMEESPDEAVKNNIFGTKILADASSANQAEKFILISTDKAVNPSSVMGITKRVCEMVCQASSQQGGTKFISVRFGNVLDSRGSVIPIFREQIRRGGPVEVTSPEMKRYFMLISEACLLVMQAGAMGEGGEVFVLDMGEPVKILDLAKDMIKFSGLEPDKDIAIVFTGIRPGEKLFEEILTAEEGVVSTKNEKIFTAKLSKVDPRKLEEKLGELQKAVAQPGKDGLKRVLMSIISE